MKANKNTIILIAFLSFLVGVLFFWKFFVQKPSFNVEKEVLPSPTSTSTFIPSPFPILSPTVYIKENIINLLPIKTEKYTIEYLPKPDKIFVLIMSEPFEKYRTEIEEWFRAQGVENLEELDISWGSARRGIP